MRTKDRRAREKEDLRQEILDAARDLFVREGYQSVSMRKIADRIEYSPGTIYLHFRDKDELFDCLLEQSFSKLLVMLQEVSRVETSDPVEGLKRGLLAYVNFGLEHPDQYQITFMTPHTLCGAAGGRTDAVGCESFACLQSAVGACIQASLFRVSDVEAASQVLWAGVHGVTSLLISKPSFPWVERGALIESMIETLIGGLRR
ncbi:MAG TPA: TetR/AcrR family transcriptional regulator [Bryobacteraceae bacterium]|nr:TetR/AcrR family transcriptional regulator [Bryobacteraceae bacterium]